MAGHKLPPEYWHRDRQRQQGQAQPPIEKPLLGLAYSDSSVIESAVVRFSFKKAGTINKGNGFFVNIPGAQKDVIFTAGHNLIDEQRNRCTDLSIWWLGQADWTPVRDEDVRISEKYEANPTSASAVDDYGIVMLPKLPAGQVRPGLGFALKLASEERLDSSLSVTAYKSDAPLGSRPTTSSGRCINPIMNRNQLEYLVPTEAGISGAPVWLGYNKYPTVVAIHNYGPRMKRPNYGSRGSFINLKVLSEIFKWINVSQISKTLRVNSARPPQPPLPLYLTWSRSDGVVKVVVQQSDDPTLMRFDLLPVYGPPIGPGIRTPAEFGFSQPHQDLTRWVSWNVSWQSATLVDDLRSARLARWEARKGLIKVPWQGDIWELIVKTDSAIVKRWDLEDPGVEFFGVGYQTAANSVQGAYNKFSLE